VKLATIYLYVIIFLNYSFKKNTEVLFLRDKSEIIHALYLKGAHLSIASMYLTVESLKDLPLVTQLVLWNGTCLIKMLDLQFNDNVLGVYG